jgi:hypothetical protein
MLENQRRSPQTAIEPRAAPDYKSLTRLNPSSKIWTLPSILPAGWSTDIRYPSYSFQPIKRCHASQTSQIRLPTRFVTRASQGKNFRFFVNHLAHRQAQSPHLAVRAWLWSAGYAFDDSRKRQQTEDDQVQPAGFFRIRRKPILLVERIQRTGLLFASPY